MSLYKIEFTQIAIKTVSKYKKSNPVQYKKLVRLLDKLTVCIREQRQDTQDRLNQAIR